MISEIIALGNRIYDTSNHRELHRMIVFIVRSWVHASSMRKLIEFFEKDEPRRKIIAQYPFPIEQVTRAFFYAGSSFEDRLKLVCNHFKYLQKIMTEEWFIKINTDYHYKIWQSADDDINWRADLHIGPGQRKEGLLAVNMFVDDITLYQIMFWLDYNKDGEISLWIGAMQGPNVENAKEIIKETTKRAHRYRTKNLILYMTMAVARNMGCKHIYAVSNEGYYANNHVRKDRKLKTDFGAFWEEVGGHITHDKRFFEIPLIEERKTMEEVPTRKRAVYRKRFEFQDDVDEQVATNLKKIIVG